MTTRRSMLGALAALAVVWPRISVAQQAARVVRIGYLTPERPASSNQPFQQLRQALRELGYVEGKNMVFEYRTAAGAPDRLPALAAELVKLNVDVIIAGGGTRSVLAAKSATQTIPIIFPTSGNPVAAGLVASLAKPGGNVTGITIASSGVTVKRLEMLREIVPNASRIAFLFDPNNPGEVVVAQIERAARTLKLDLTVVPVHGTADLNNTLEDIARKRVDAVLLSGSGLFPPQAARLASWGVKHRMPIIGDSFELPEGGCLVSYGASRVGTVGRAAALVDKVLKGAKPADLPVEQPREFDLIINAKTAKALGITIPQSVLLQANRVIE